ncbi:IS1634 family transposase, partial [Adlercreutzia sp. ZJ138]|uniref:IS1634 family transposase n=1 Tax=Adlercreutzia sp. ZJ138 TaxID=2709405 RepID=UPI0013EC622D
LLLDADCIPLGMVIYPGNESEKPVIREVISQTKRRNNMYGRTVRVADKGLNCADNVSDAILSGDGYIFSKSVKQLPTTELSWVLSDEGWSNIADKDGEIIYRVKSCVADFEYKVTTDSGGKKAVPVEEKRVATFNPKLARKQRAEIDRQVEKARRLRLSQAKKSEYSDCAKFVTFSAVDSNGEEPDAKVVATLNHTAIEKARRLAGYNMIVTSEMSMSDADIYSTYHNLWRIEESFKAMKSQLDARPVYLQKSESITGHFLICYLSVLLERLVQLKVLDGRFCTEEIMRLAHNYRVVEVSERKYVNISKSLPIIDELEKMTGLPLGNYYLTKGQVDSIVNCQFNIPNVQ